MHIRKMLNKMLKRYGYVLEKLPRRENSIKLHMPTEGKLSAHDKIKAKLGCLMNTIKYEDGISKQTLEQLETIELAVAKKSEDMNIDYKTQDLLLSMVNEIKNWRCSNG